MEGRDAERREEHERERERDRALARDRARARKAERDPRQALQRWLHGDEATGPMPIVDRLRGTPFRDLRRMSAPEDVQARAAVDFALRLGELLFRSGAGTREVETSLIAATAALGLTHVEVDITVQSMVLQHAPPGRPPLTLVRVARAESRDFARLAAAHSLVADLVAGRLGRDEAVARLDAVETAAKPWPRWVAGSAWGVLAAAVCVLVGGGALAALVAFASSVAVDGLGRVLGRRGLPPFFLTFVGAALASVVTVLAVQVGALQAHDAGPVIAGGIVVLLPGRLLVSAVEDAISGFSVTASGRVLSVLLTAAAIISGVGIGLGLARRLDLVLAVDAVGTSAADVTRGILSAGVATAATAVGGRSRRVDVLPAVVVGVVAYGGFGLLRIGGLAGPTVATAVAAVVVGLLGRLAAQRLHAPALVLVVPALSALLPGLTIFRGMSEIARGSGAGVPTLFSATSTALAIGAGVVLGDYLAAPADRARSRRRRPPPDPATPSP